MEPNSLNHNGRVSEVTKISWGCHFTSRECFRIFSYWSQCCRMFHIDCYRGFFPIYKNNRQACFQFLLVAPFEYDSEEVLRMFGVSSDVVLHKYVFKWFLLVAIGCNLSECNLHMYAHSGEWTYVFCKTTSKFEGRNKCYYWVIPL